MEIVLRPVKLDARVVEVTAPAVVLPSVREYAAVVKMHAVHVLGVLVALRFA